MLHPSQRETFITELFLIQPVIYFNSCDSVTRSVNKCMFLKNESKKDKHFHNSLTLSGRNSAPLLQPFTILHVNTETKGRKSPYVSRCDLTHEWAWLKTGNAGWGSGSWGYLLSPPRPTPLSLEGSDFISPAVIQADVIFRRRRQLQLGVYGG